jgi:hypothetical protein
VSEISQGHEFAQVYSGWSDIALLKLTDKALPKNGGADVDAAISFLISVDLSMNMQLRLFAKLRAHRCFREAASLPDPTESGSDIAFNDCRTPFIGPETAILREPCPWGQNRPWEQAPHTSFHHNRFAGKDLAPMSRPQISPGQAAFTRVAERPGPSRPIGGRAAIPRRVCGWQRPFARLEAELCPHPEFLTPRLQRRMIFAVDL